MKTKRSLVIVLALILSLSVLVSCNNDKEPEKEKAILTYAEGIEIPEGMILPFNEEGKLIWDESEVKDFLVLYTAKDKPQHASLKKEEKAQQFVNLLNEANKELIVATRQPSKVIDEFTRGEKIYNFEAYRDNMYISISIYKDSDNGYLEINLNGNNFDNYSVYRISLDTLGKIEELVEGLEKTEGMLTAKPVLYLYPEDKQDVSVDVEYKGELTTTYPKYNNGWKVTAFPDGHLINKSDGLEHSYLFWEGIPTNKEWWNFDEGYCVAGSDTASFLQEKLSGFGMTPKEYNEFIVYWLPEMEKSPYNLISFQWEEYEKLASLTILPKPESMLRIFMVFTPLNNRVEIKEPAERKEFVREGFTVVEWGATKTEKN